MGKEERMGSQGDTRSREARIGDEVAIPVGNRKLIRDEAIRECLAIIERNGVDSQAAEDQIRALLRD